MTRPRSNSQLARPLNSSLQWPAVSDFSLIFQDTQNLHISASLLMCKELPTTNPLFHITHKGASSSNPDIHKLYITSHFPLSSQSSSIKIFFPSLLKRFLKATWNLKISNPLAYYLFYRTCCLSSIWNHWWLPPSWKIVFLFSPLAAPFVYVFLRSLPLPNLQFFECPRAWFLVSSFHSLSPANLTQCWAINAVIVGATQSPHLHLSTELLHKSGTIFPIPPGWCLIDILSQPAKNQTTPLALKTCSLWVSHISVITMTQFLRPELREIF